MRTSDPWRGPFAEETQRIVRQVLPVQSGQLNDPCRIISRCTRRSQPGLPKRTRIRILAYNAAFLTDRATHAHARPPPPRLLPRPAARGRSRACALHDLAAARSLNPARIQGHRVSRRAFPGRAGPPPGLKPHPRTAPCRDAHAAPPVQRAAAAGPCPDSRPSTAPAVRPRSIRTAPAIGIAPQGCIRSAARHARRCNARG